MRKLLIITTLIFTSKPSYSQRIFSDDFVFKIGLYNALNLHRDDMSEIRKFLIEELGFVYDLEKSSNNYHSLSRSERTNERNVSNELMVSILDSREKNKKQCTMILTKFEGDQEIDINTSFINFLNNHPKISKMESFYFFILKDENGTIKFSCSISPQFFTKSIIFSAEVIKAAEDVTRKDILRQ